MLQVALSLVATCMVLKCYYSNPSVKEMPTWIRVIVLDWLAKIVRVKVPPGLINVMTKHVKEEEKVQGEIEYVRRNSMLPPTLVGRNEGRDTFVGDLQSRLRSSSLTSPGRNRCRTFSSERDYAFEGDGLSTIGLPKLFHTFARSLQSINEEHAQEVKTNEPQPTSGSVPVILEATMKEMLLKQDSLLNNVRRLVQVTREQEKNDIKKEEWKIVASIIDACFFWVFMAALIISSVVIFLQAPTY